LRKLSKLSDEELHLAYSQVISKIKFFNDELIPSHIWLKAEIIANEIDPDDIPFIALSDYLNAQLWTGDKKLYTGLLKRKWNNCIKTDDLYVIVNQSIMC